MPLRGHYIRTYGKRTREEHCVTELPYISIVSEMMRGFHEACVAIGSKKSLPVLVADGGKLRDESDELQVDLLTSLRRLIVAPNS